MESSSGGGEGSQSNDANKQGKCASPQSGGGGLLSHISAINSWGIGGHNNNNNNNNNTSSSSPASTRPLLSLVSGQHTKSPNKSPPSSSPQSSPKAPPPENMDDDVVARAYAAALQAANLNPPPSTHHTPFAQVMAIGSSSSSSTPQHFNTDTQQKQLLEMHRAAAAEKEKEAAAAHHQQQLNQLFKSQEETAKHLQHAMQNQVKSWQDSVKMGKEKLREGLKIQLPGHHHHHSHSPKPNAAAPAASKAADAKSDTAPPTSTSEEIKPTDAAKKENTTPSTSTTETPQPKTQPPTTSSDTSQQSSIPKSSSPNSSTTTTTNTTTTTTTNDETIPEKTTKDDKNQSSSTAPTTTSNSTTTPIQATLSSESKQPSTPALGHLLLNQLPSMPFLSGNAASAPTAAAAATAAVEIGTKAAETEESVEKKQKKKDEKDEKEATAVSQASKSEKENASNSSTPNITEDKEEKATTNTNVTTTTTNNNNNNKVVEKQDKEQSTKVLPSSSPSAPTSPTITTTDANSNAGEQGTTTGGTRSANPAIMTTTTTTTTTRRDSSRSLGDLFNSMMAGSSSNQADATSTTTTATNSSSSNNTASASGATSGTVAPAPVKRGFLGGVLPTKQQDSTVEDKSEEADAAAAAAATTGNAAASLLRRASFSSILPPRPAPSTSSSTGGGGGGASSTTSLPPAKTEADTSAGSTAGSKGASFALVQKRSSSSLDPSTPSSTSTSASASARPPLPTPSSSATPAPKAKGKPTITTQRSPPSSTGSNVAGSTTVVSGAGAGAGAGAGSSGTTPATSPLTAALGHASSSSSSGSSMAGVPKLSPPSMRQPVWKRRDGFGKLAANAWERRELVLKDATLAYFTTADAAADRGRDQNTSSSSLDDTNPTSTNVAITPTASETAVMAFSKRQDSASNRNKWNGAWIWEQAAAVATKGVAGATSGGLLDSNDVTTGGGGSGNAPFHTATTPTAAGNVAAHTPRGSIDMIRDQAVVSTYHYSRDIYGAPTPFILSVRVKGGHEAKWTFCFDTHQDQMEWLNALSNLVVRQSIGGYLEEKAKESGGVSSGVGGVVGGGARGMTCVLDGDYFSLGSQMMAASPRTSSSLTDDKEVKQKEKDGEDTKSEQKKQEENNEQDATSANDADTGTEKTRSTPLPTPKDSALSPTSTMQPPKLNMQMLVLGANVLLYGAYLASSSMLRFIFFLVCINGTVWYYMNQQEKAALAKKKKQALAAKAAAARAAKKKAAVAAAKTSDAEPRSVASSDKASPTSLQPSHEASGSALEKEEVVGPPVAGSTTRGVAPVKDGEKEPERDPSSTEIQWTTVPGSQLNVRSLGYDKHKKKIPSPGTLYECSAVDVFVSDAREDDLGGKVRLPKVTTTKGKGNWTSPDCFIVTLAIPSEAPKMGWATEDGHGVSIVAYFTMSDETRRILQHITNTNAGENDSNAEGECEFDKQKVNAVRLWEEWCQRAPNDAAFQGRFKFLFYAVNATEIGLPSYLEKYNGKPVLIKRAGVTGILHSGREESMEMVINLHAFPFLAKQAFSYMYENFFSKVIINLGCVIEGRGDEELPEVVMGVFQLRYPDPQCAARLDEIFPASA